VIHRWLQEQSRDEIASDLGISTGSVSNIIKSLIDSLVEYDIDALRDFVVQVGKANLTVKECADGYRIQSILVKLGISDEEKLEVFLKNAYQLCTRLDVNLTIIQDSLFELIYISKEILPSQLKDHIKRQIAEKKTLESQIRNLKEEIQKIEKAKSDAEKNFVLTKDKIGISSAELAWYTNIKDALEKEGIPIDDISLLCTTIAKIKNIEIRI
jgi:DNA-binding Lrp family transcriptional regulator